MPTTTQPLCVQSATPIFVAVLLYFCVSGATAIGGAVAADFQDEIPEALSKTLATHSTEYWTTAKLDWMIVDSRFPEQPAHARFYSWQCAGEDVLAVKHGDEYGVSTYMEDGGIGRNGTDAIRVLRKSDEAWTVEGVTARKSRAADADEIALRDWRTTGLNPVSITHEYKDLDRFWQGYERRYKHNVEDGLHVVEVRLFKNGRGDYHSKYWIDENKAWSVVKTASFDHEQPVLQTTFDQQLVDGTWIPMRIETRNRDGRILSWMEVIYAEIDHPDHPNELTLADLRMEPGTMIVAQPGAGQSGAWDGKQVLSISELNERIANGTAPASPAYLREVRRLQYLAELDPPTEEARIVAAHHPAAPGDSALRRYESEWERYVREFIAKYALNDEQAEKCRGILRACQDQARQYLDRHREEVEKLERDLSTKYPNGAPAQPAASAPAKADEPKSPEAALLARRAELLAPINDIFENKLKPRLQRIPTRAQRASVEAAATTRPVGER